jgi:site-specific DNA recombinase
MKTYVAYIRVSTVKQGVLGSSLQEQRDAILAFATRHQFNIVEWYEDRETAAKKGRAQFMRMMTVLEKRKAAGVILHKIDRGARNLWDWARIQDLIDAGVEVHFAHDNLDLKSRGGRLAADIQAVVAADYVRNLRDEVRKGILGRLKQGLYPRQAPVGYLDQGKAKAKIVDPIKGPLVQAAFELYATRRYSYETLAKELHRRGLRRASGKPLSFCGVATILRNPFYMGVIRIKKTGETFQGIHEPLVAAKTFRLVQEVIDGRDNHKVQRFDFAYRRLLKCGLCSSVLTGELQKGRAYYRCHMRGCKTTGIREDAINAALKVAVEALVFTETDYAEIEPYLEEREKASLADRAKLVSAYKLRITAIEDREKRLTDAYLDQALERDTYLSRKLTLLTDLAEARENLARSGRDTGGGAAGVKKIFELAKSLDSGPNSQSPSEYRRIVETLTSNRTLIGKKLCVAIRSPFHEAICALRLFSGAPARRNFRTCTTQSTLPEKRRLQTRETIHAKRAHVLFERLKQWRVPEEFSDAGSEAKRKSQPHWFKPKDPPRATT